MVWHLLLLKKVLIGFSLRPGDFGVSSQKQTFFSGFCAATYRDDSMIGILINLIFRNQNLSKAGAIIVKEKPSPVLVRREDSWYFVV